ncbi:MAG: Clp protease N-terminal domain-containing protein [Acidimicrobiales bacterium]
MTPPPTLQQLIETVRADAPGDTPLDQLTQASKTASDLEEVTDALLGHFVDRCRHQGHSWSEISAALGVTKQAAHKRFTPAGPPTFERFTPRARRALQAAATQARRLGSSQIKSEHLLLGLFDLPQGIAAQVLTESNVTQERVLAQLGGTPVGDADEKPSDTPMPYTADAKDVLRSAVMEALQLSHNYIGTEHLLLALYAEPPTAATSALVALGASHDEIAAKIAGKIEAILSQYNKEGVPNTEIGGTGKA